MLLTDAVTFKKQQEYILCTPSSSIQLSQTYPKTTMNPPQTQVHSVEDFNVHASNTGLANSQSENTSTHEIHLSDIVELLVIHPKVSKRNIRKRKSTFLTSTPIKDQLEENENRKRVKAE
ncbi:hypothetical protein HHI36_008030 [Cryptolaemus montrouzieri]|uniref:Uncharacterized protein n=1 Tax=Cryptolaemus montrouzieri TaxID=559131 RepID=A0ABD2MR86_9CUCU